MSQQSSAATQISQPEPSQAHRQQARLWRARGDLVALLLLVLLAVVVFWRLALTELIIGRGDLFFYFYPYRDYASAALRVGRIPLWNPYLFMGVPFFANSQAGVLYPLNVLMAGLPVERMVNASILLHVMLAGIGAYLWGRLALGLGRCAAWVVGLCFGLGGYFVAQVEHLNQVQVLAWLPWLLWLFPWPLAPTRPAPKAPATRNLRFLALALIIAFQLLAGHTQAVFICLVGLSSYAGIPLIWETIRRRATWRQVAGIVAFLAGVVLFGAALAAIQLVPTFELSQLSIRSGGLPFNEAVSFSLRPDLIGRALLPSWGQPLFPEFVAYVGLVALGLVTVGVSSLWQDRSAQVPRINRPQTVHVSYQVRLGRRGALLLAALGLFLALGGFNPVYILMVKFMPGFGLFRAPARWLALYALGAAGLAGLGLEEIRASATKNVQTPAMRGRLIFVRGWAVVSLILAALVLVGQVLNTDPEATQLPALGLVSLIGWFSGVLIFVGVLYLVATARLKGARPVVGPLLCVLVAGELLGASIFLPINRATAPGALTSLRPAVAHLIGQAGMTTPAPPDRYLSISDIFFDPGDKPEIEIAFGPQLSSDALYDYIIATKQKEVLIPNLPLYYRLPTVDGYDGGLLPLRRYVTLEYLYMPHEQVAIDGRLRENLKRIPSGRWLSLFNVRYLITDKVGDAWFDDVFYDLQMGATLANGEEAWVTDVPRLPATAIGIVYSVDGSGAMPSEAKPLATLQVAFADGGTLALSLSETVPDTGAQAARLSWDRARTVSAIHVQGTWSAGEVIIRGLSLIDERTGVFQSLVLSDNGRYRLVHSGDVKIYENLDALPRAFFVNQAFLVPDDNSALVAMADPDFDPATTAILVDNRLSGQTSAIGASASDSLQPSEVTLLHYEPERIVAQVRAPAQGWLVLTDAWYPGWEATIDGQPAFVERANILFRAVAVPAGQHQVEWFYRPASYRWGAIISLCALGLLTAVAIWVGRRGATGRVSADSYRRSNG